MNSLEEFRLQTRDWLESNCPGSMRTRMVPGEQITGGKSDAAATLTLIYGSTG